MDLVVSKSTGFPVLATTTSKVSASRGPLCIALLVLGGRGRGVGGGDGAWGAHVLEATASAEAASSWRSLELA